MQRLATEAQAVLDEDAGVLNYNEAGGASFCGCGVIFDSLLHPDYFCTDSDGAVDDGWDVFGAPKDVDDFDVLRFWDVFQTRVAFFAEDFRFVGIHGDDVVTGRPHVLGDAETGAPRIRREAHYRDGFMFFEDVGDYVFAAR